MPLIMGLSIENDAKTQTERATSPSGYAKSDIPLLESFTILKDGQSPEDLRLSPDDYRTFINWLQNGPAHPVPSVPLRILCYYRSNLEKSMKDFSTTDGSRLKQQNLVKTIDEMVRGGDDNNDPVEMCATGGAPPPVVPGTVTPTGLDCCDELTTKMTKIEGDIAGLSTTLIAPTEALKTTLVGSLAGISSDIKDSLAEIRATKAEIEKIKVLIQTAPRPTAPVPAHPLKPLKPLDPTLIANAEEARRKLEAAIKRAQDATAALDAAPDDQKEAAADVAEAAYREAQALHEEADRLYNLAYPDDSSSSSAAGPAAPAPGGLVGPRPTAPPALPARWPRPPHAGGKRLPAQNQVLHDGSEKAIRRLKDKIDGARRGADKKKRSANSQRIQQMEQQLAALVAALAALTREIKEKRNTNDEAKNKAAGLELEIEQLSQMLQDAQRDATQLSKYALQVTQYMSSVVDKHKEFIELQRKALKALGVENARLKQEIAKAATGINENAVNLADESNADKEELAAAKAAINSYKEDLADAQAAINSYKADEAETKARLAVLNAQLQENEAARARLEAAAADLTQQVDRAVALSRRLFDGRKSEREQKEALIIEKNELTAQLAVARAELVESNTAKAGLEARIHSLEEELRTACSRCVIPDKPCPDHAEEIAELTAKLAAATAANETLTGKVGALEAQYKAATVVAAQLTQRLENETGLKDAALADKVRLEGELAGLRVDLSGATVQIADLQRKAQTLQEELDECRRNPMPDPDLIRRLQQELAAARAEIETHKGQIRDLQSDIANKDQLLAAWDLRDDEWNKAYDNLQAELDKQVALTAKQLEQIQQRNEKIGANAATIGDLNKQVAQLKEQMAAADAKHNKKIAELKVLFDNLAVEVRAQKAELLKVTAERDELSRQLQSIGGNAQRRAAGLEEQLRQAAQRIREQQGLINELSALVETTKAGYERKVTVLSDEIRRITGEKMKPDAAQQRFIADLQQQIRDLQATVAQLTEDIDNLEQAPAPAPKQNFSGLEAARSKKLAACSMCQRFPNNREACAECGHIGRIQQGQQGFQQQFGITKGLQGRRGGTRVKKGAKFRKLTRKVVPLK
jgi:chromosome segregation ATPase